MCSWVLCVAHGPVGERAVDTIGVGHVKVWEAELGVPYVLPLVRGGSQVGGRAQRGSNIEVGVRAACGAQGSRRGWGWGGGGGGISSAGAARRGEEEGLRRAGLEKAGASGSRAAFTAELGPASPLSLLGPSSRRATVSTEAARVRAALGIRWALIKLQEPVRVVAPDLCPYPALPPETPLPFYGPSWSGQDLSYPCGEKGRRVWCSFPLQRPVIGGGWERGYVSLLKYVCQCASVFVCNCDQ